MSINESTRTVWNDRANSSACVAREHMHGDITRQVLYIPRVDDPILIYMSSYRSLPGMYIRSIRALGSLATRLVVTRADLNSVDAESGLIIFSIA